MANRYIIMETIKDSNDVYERCRLQSLEEAREVWKDIIKGAENNAQYESCKRKDPYWISLDLIREEYNPACDEFSGYNGIDWETLEVYRSKTYISGCLAIHQN